jgi:hypothetical protein
MKPTCDCGLNLLQSHFVHHKFTWTGMGSNRGLHGDKLATNRPSHCKHLPTQISLHLRVLTIEGVKTLLDRPHRKINKQDWKSSNSFRAIVRYTAQKVCSMRRSTKCHLNRTGHNLPHFKGLTLVITALFWVTTQRVVVIS